MLSAEQELNRLESEQAELEEQVASAVLEYRSRIAFDYQCRLSRPAMWQIVTVLLATQFM
ncbi:MAG: hypothetical protein A3H31_05305 [Gallionellales bacterium RIFCSPLOWO2_02_FULL_57_47]|nr:MAG: hypothetical protein A3H31_05305 [Gallionellales bacterium RIFCSPLOWO2_02_FULL_57_47]OGT18238.1 MAG: hypothetical protein A3J49_20095 [Gallionellales bacterium RIFCSPHIGHO2_02_FULL_57_16]